METHCLHPYTGIRKETFGKVRPTKAEGPK